MFGTRMELGRIAGIVIYLDMMFVLVLLVFTYPYFTGGSTQMMSAGLVIVIGLLLSILLHELGHAFVGRLFNAHVSHIELTGLGGIAHFERSLPRSALARSAIYLAGPAVNLGLWQGLGWLAGQSMATGNPMLALPLAVLASSNFFLMCFNLLPAYPLDGGLDARCLAGRAAGAHVVGAHRRLPRAGRGLRRRALCAAERHLHAVRRLLPGAGQLGRAAERRRLVAAKVAGANLGSHLEQLMGR